MKDPNQPESDSESQARTLAGSPELSPLRSEGPGESAGHTIDRYTLVEKLGQGGMGTVWMAQQSEPVKRRVALKIIKLGMDTREVVARFEIERQALALMDHPHIAKVLDAGATTSGRPYFVMELVHGTRITTFCDEAGLDLRQRLELFSKVCIAIQHAHHKGIIHRDVKPSNILVSMQDGVPLPKVIDFGIAKATATDGERETLVTRHSHVVGTPEYMAPEQTEGGGLDIDTRVDVYSLGVLLYELLTGTKPFDVPRTGATSYEDILRVIREKDPAKPSTRVSSRSESASSDTSERRVETRVLNKHLRGDLDWIVMKALDKDRARRYETANAFAADIENFLNDEPVDAAPPSASYRLAKLLRRRKKTVISVATIALLLIAGSVGTGVGWWKATQANRLLDEALAQEEQQRLLAEENEVRARNAEDLAVAEAERATQAEADTQARAEELEQVVMFQAEQILTLDVGLMGDGLREALIGAHPPGERAELSQRLEGVNFTRLMLGTLRENLFERTIDAIDSQFENQPLVRAQLLQSTAVTWAQLGLLALVIDPQTRALELRRAELGDEHPETLSSMNNLGFLLRSQGRADEAELLFRQSLEGNRRALGNDHMNTLGAMMNLVLSLQSQGKLAEAETLAREGLEICRSAYGDDHPDTRIALNQVGGVLQAQGEFREAVPFFREELEASRRILGDEHPDTLFAITEMDTFLREYVQSARETGSALEQGEALASLGAFLVVFNQYAEAEGVLTDALLLLFPNAPEGSAAPWQAQMNLAQAIAGGGRFEEAEPILIESMQWMLGNEDALSELHDVGSPTSGADVHQAQEDFYAAWGK